MRFKSLALILSVIFLLAGCGSETGLSKEDLGIRKIDDPKAKVVYGMSRADAEKVLGAGEKSGFAFNYENDVRVYYREEKVVGVSFDEEAKDVYETTSGVKIGMLESEVKKAYGNKFAQDGGNLTYFYDSSTDKFSTDGSPKMTSEEEARNVFVLDIRFNKNGYADWISLLDQPMAKFGR